MRSRSEVVEGRGVYYRLTSWLMTYLGYIESYVIGSKLAPSLYDYFKRIAAAIIAIPTIAAIYMYMYITSKAIVPVYIAIAMAVFTAIAVALPLSLALIIALPLIMYSNRGAVLEARFPLIVLYLGSYLASGMSITSALLEMYKHKDETKFDVEFEYIRYCIHIGKPVDQVLAEVAKITPSPSFRQLVISLSSVARSGIPAIEAIRAIYQRYRDAYRATIERALGVLGVIFEGYLALTVLVPLVTGTIGALTALMPVGIDVYTLIFFTVFVLVPFASLASIVIADITVSRLRM